MSKGLFKNSAMFAPGMIKQLMVGSSPVLGKGDLLSGSNIESTASFRYDSPWKPGVKSTQQIPLDWSNFANHIFFNSAESKVNVAFDNIINDYPFDGTYREYEAFFDNLPGFEKYVYDIFPKWLGFLHFSGTTFYETPAGNPTTGGTYAAELGTHIKVEDVAGALLPTLSKKDDGQNVIGPKHGKSISFDMQLFIPPVANEEQIILQKLSDEQNGLTIGLDRSTSATTCLLSMIISSGSVISDLAVITASMNVEKGRFTQVGAIFNNEQGVNQIELYQSGVLLATSSFRQTFDKFIFYSSNLLIGSGVQHQSSSEAMPNPTDQGNFYFTPKQTFSGALDELRIFHGVRSKGNQKTYQFKNVFPTGDLKLYYKFNEVTGSYTNNRLVLDSSGNSLHAAISNFTESLRDLKMGTDVTQSLPLKNERLNLNPVLFPSSKDVISLNVNLLLTASRYDANNPNLITKLIPRHFLLEGKAEEGYNTVDGNVAKPYAEGSRDFPGGGRLGSPQIITLLTLMWGKYFDELKIFSDHFSKLLHVDYTKEDMVADQFLTFVGQYYGFALPGFYTTATPEQYNEGENLLADPTYSKFSLRHVQNELWRRILASLNDIMRSKGTTHSIKSLIRAAGLNPDNNFRFREFGGAKSRLLLETRRLKSEYSSMLDFSGSLASVTDPEAVNAQGIHPSRPFIMSPFLSGSRIEVGFPTPEGTFVSKNKHPLHGISDDRDDGLFTSGSFTYEALYKFDTFRSGNIAYHTSQSLMRLHSTGTSAYANTQAIFFNLVTISESLERNRTGSIELLGRPTVTAASGPVLHLVLTGVNIFDGNVWHVSWGRQCAEEIGSLHSSSYFLRVGRQNHGKLFRYYSSSSLFIEWPQGGNKRDDGLSKVMSTDNASGTFVVIGSQSVGTNTAGYFLNDEALQQGLLPHVTNFDGKVSQLRFWSKALTPKEDREHIINFKSVGVRDPLKNFNFVTQETGSFERLRLDIPMHQIITSSNPVGGISLFDTTQNFSSGTRGGPWVNTDTTTHPSDGYDKMLFKMSGTGFAPNFSVIKPQQFYYSHIDSKFDERSEFNKIRIRSWENQDNIKYDEGAVAAPLYDVLKSEEPEDDNRFLVESSFVQALDEDIVSIFGGLEILNTMMGNPELIFSLDYPDLRNLRDVYFNRLNSRIKIKEFFEFFKWFDDSLGTMIEHLLPKKTNFLGVQFTIESHMLERAKFHYNYADTYLPPGLNLHMFGPGAGLLEGATQAIFYPGDGPDIQFAVILDADTK